MIIQVLIAYDKTTGEILFSEGIEDGNQYVQVIVPIEMITEEDSENFHEYDKKRYDNTKKGEPFNLGEAEAYHISDTYEKLRIEIVNVEIGNNISDIKK